MDILKIIQDSYESYSDNWRKLISAFIVLFIFGVVVGVIDLVGRLSSDTICKATNDTLLVLIFCISPLILQYGLGVVGGLLNTLITIALIKPIDEIGGRKTVSNWTEHFTPQLLNAILVMVLRGLLSIIIFAPFILILVGSIPVLVALGNKSNILALVGGELLLVIITLAVSCVVWSVVMFLLTFLEIEIVLGGHGVLDAGVKSANLVKNNLEDALIFSIIWFMIRMAVGALNILLLCSICLIPLMFLINPFIVEPIELMSKVAFWRKLNKSS